MALHDSLFAVITARCNGNPIKAAKVGTFIVQWAVTHAAMGHAPTTAEYAEYWRVTDRTGRRELERFRAVFPELGATGTPDVFVGPLLAAREELTPGDIGVLMDVPSAVVFS